MKTVSIQLMFVIDYFSFGLFITLIIAIIIYQSSTCMLQSYLTNHTHKHIYMEKRVLIL